MNGSLVHANNLDSVRIEVLGERRALTIPLDLVLAVDRLMKVAAMHDQRLSLYQSAEDRWFLEAGEFGFGEGASPWGAVIDWDRRLPQ